MYLNNQLTSKHLTEILENSTITECSRNLHMPYDDLSVDLKLSSWNILKNNLNMAWLHIIAEYIAYLS